MGRGKAFWKFSLLSIALLAALFSCFYFWTRSVEKRKWAEMQQVVRRLASEGQERGGSRPLLYGEATPGNAWDDYSAALAESWRIYNGRQKNLRAFLDNPESVDLDALRADLQICAPLIERVRQASRRAEVVRDCVAPDGLWKHFSISTWYLSAMFSCHIRLLRRDGRSDEALRCLLDFLQMRQDLGDTDLQGTLEDLGLLLMQDSLSAEDLSVLETAMERAEHPAVTGQWMGLEQLALHGSILLRGHGSWISSLPNWRYGFSSRLQQADAFLALERLARARTRLTGEELRRFERNWGRDHSRNRLAGEHHSSFQRNRTPSTGNLARIRLLRIGARFRRTGDILAMDDPCGEMIRHSEEDIGDRFWSAGPDEKDDGGEGIFEIPRPKPGIPAARSKDIVLEIPRGLSAEPPGRPLGRPGD